MLTLLFQGWCCVAAMMLVLWLRQWRTNDASLVDVGWTYGLGLLAVFYAVYGTGWIGRRLLLGLLAGVWSLRLGTYLYLNRVRGKPEDGRYQTLRTSWGKRQHPYFFLFFQAQALLDVIFSLSFLPIALDARVGFTALEWGAIGLWLVAIGGEALADVQLAKFRSDRQNRGRTCRLGLWRYSRHPNYFFEWLHWWTYVLLGISAPRGALTLVAPALLLYLLWKVTGIPATEAQALKSRGEDYRRYQAETSAFIPWFPRKGVLP